MHVTAHKLRDRRFGTQWKDQVEDRWEYADFLKDDGWRKDWISFDCLCHDPATDTEMAVAHQTVLHSREYPSRIDRAG